LSEPVSVSASVDIYFPPASYLSLHSNFTKVFISSIFVSFARHIHYLFKNYDYSVYQVAYIFYVQFIFFSNYYYYSYWISHFSSL